MTRGWGLLIGLATVSLALFAAYGGVLTVLLPRQLAIIVSADKVEALAVVTAVASGVTAFAQPLFGAASDRTRSRWGRRVPWMAAGALIGGIALGAMGVATSVAWLALLWTIAQFALNGVDIATSVYLVDAYPSRRRGAVAGVLGVSAVVGTALGSALSSSVAGSPAIGYLVLALLAIASVGAFAFAFGRHEPFELLEVPPFRLVSFVRGFWVNPRRHPAFAWMLGWRIAFAVGSTGVQAYLLYILTDYVRVDARAAPGVAALATAISGAAVVVAVLAGGWLSDRLGRRKPFLLGASVLVAGVELVPLLLPTVAGVVIVAVGIGLGLGLAIACGAALASEVLPDPDGSAGRGLGVVNFGTNVGQALGPLLAAVAISSGFGYPGLFVGGAVFLLAAAGMVLGIRGAR
jgi:MFS family permease